MGFNDATFKRAANNNILHEVATNLSTKEMVN